MFSVDSLFRMNKLLSIFAVFLLSLKCSASETMCSFNKKTCQCVFQNGSIIDLSSLGNRDDTAKWRGMKAEKRDNYEYYYNPCFSFKLGPESGSCSKGVAVCQVNASKKEYYNCGDSDSVNFVFDGKNNWQLTYYANTRRTNVTLICSEDATTPKLKVNGELKMENYEMTLTTKCACPDLCVESHLSTGSVLVILFMISVTLYLVFGIIHSSLTRGAHGWELIPHYEFWADFPLLVRDGCVFVLSGCKPETAYERI